MACLLRLFQWLLFVCWAVHSAPVAALEGASVDPPGASERGTPWIDNIGPDTYGSWRGHVAVSHAQNWSVAQGADGRLYVANQEGLLAYDGERWNAIPVGVSQATGRRSKRVLSVGRLPDGHPDAGRILVAAEGTFGVLRPDSLGRSSFVALSDRLPQDERDLGIVWKTSATSRAGYFLTGRRLFRWADDSLHVWTTADLSLPSDEPPTDIAPPEDREFFFSFVVRDTLYVQVRGVGLFRAEGTRLRLLPDGRRFADDGIYAILPHGDDGLLIGTRSEGLFRHDGIRATALDWPIEPWLNAHQLYHGTRLPDGSYALGTRQGGVLHMTAEGQRIRVWDATTGLQADKVHHTFVDRDGSLWLALDEGLSRVDLQAPYTYISSSMGLNAPVETLERHAGRLFVGTASGLYRLEGRPGTVPRLRPVPGFDLEVTDLRSTPHGLVVVSQRQVRVWRADTSYPVTNGRSDTTPRVVLVSRVHPDVAYVGCVTGGIVRLRVANGRWQQDAWLPNVDISISELAEGDDGTLWAAGFTEGTVRIQQPTTDAPTVSRYGLTDGLPVLIDLNVFAVNGRVVFGTRQGLHRFDPKTERFMPDSTFGATWAASSHYVTHLVSKTNRRLWGRAADLTDRTAGRIVAPLRQTDTGSWTHGSSLPPVRSSVVRTIHPEPDAVWLGGRGIAPLIHLDRTSYDPWTPSPLARSIAQRTPLIRTVTVGPADSLVYGNASAAPPRLAASSGPIDVAYAVPAFVHTVPVQYRTRLGTDGDWTAWSSDASITYASLSSGTHTLQVQARTDAGRTPVAALSIRVATPWYRTVWAWSVWGLLFIGGGVGLGWGAVQWRTRRLEAHQEALQAQVETRTAELRTEKQRTAEALDTVAEQKEALEALHAAQSEFFANVSHEFRTPLTVALGLLNEWIDASPDRPLGEAQDDLHHVLLHNQRLLRLVNQLLDIARLESDTLDLHVQWLDPAARIEDLALAFVGWAERRNITFQRTLADDSLRIAADPHHLETIVTNLLSNAFKHTPNGGCIALTLATDDHHLVLRVSDTGPGIPPNEQDAIFDRFHQSSTPKRSSGTGIGLALTKALVERHNGQIAVESTVGQGATFTVRLPHGAEHLAHRPDVSWQSGDTEPFATNRPPVPTMSSRPEQTGSPDATDDRPTVLVVDDNPDIRAYVERHLTPTYRVYHAAGGEAGVQAAREHTPDCIVADVMMPRVDGLEMLARLRDDPATDFLPVILLTARAAPEDKMAGLDAGADDYLTKPFRPDELSTRIRNLLAQRLRLQERLQERFQAEYRLLLKTEDSDEPPFLRAVKQTIREKISDTDLTVDDVAEGVGVSRSKLYRELRSVADTTPAELIWWVRLEEARRLLEKGEGIVSEVAYGVGFKSVSHFTHRFRDRFGELPSAVVASHG